VKRLWLMLFLGLVTGATAAQSEDLPKPLKGHIDCDAAGDDYDVTQGATPSLSCSFIIRQDGSDTKHDAQAQQIGGAKQAVIMLSRQWQERFSEDPIISFTLVLTIFNVLLWRETRRIATGADIALKTAERAFVFLDGFDVEITTAADSKVVEIELLPNRYRSRPDLFLTRFAIFPRWKNGGNTPTKSLKIQINWGGPTGHVPPDYIYARPPTPFFLAPKAAEISAEIEIPPAASLINWGMSPIGEEPHIWIWGRADYEDVFGRPHFTEWCRRLRFDNHRGERLRAQFIQWGDYNRTDEDITT
jgi:hypothetical protein